MSLALERAFHRDSASHRSLAIAAIWPLALSEDMLFYELCNTVRRTRPIESRSAPSELSLFSSESVLNILIDPGRIRVVRSLADCRSLGGITWQWYVMHHLASRRRRNAPLLRSRAQSSWICGESRTDVDFGKGRILRHSRLSEGAGLCCRHSAGAYLGRYRDRVLPYGIRAVWSRPLFTREGKVLGTFAILYREVRTPDAHRSSADRECQPALRVSRSSGTCMRMRCGMNATVCDCCWKSQIA